MRVPIQEWINGYKTDEELRYKNGAIQLAMFFRDRLARCVARTFSEFEGCATVIAEHRSKSVILPVVLLERPGLSVVARDNFHNVAISVKRESDVPLDRLASLIEEPDSDVSLTYCEGFPKEWGFGAFARDPKRFTCHVGNQFEAYAFLRMVGVCTP